MASSRRKPKTKAERAAFSNKISNLSREGYNDPKQRVAIAYSELRSGGLKRLKESHGGKRSGARRRRGGA